MITCQICKNEYKIITNQHLSKHGMTTKQYLSEFPDSKLLSEDTKKKYAEGTKKYYSRASKEEVTSRYKNRVYSDESKDKIRVALMSNKHKINYNDPKRVKAISNAKKKWWASKTKEERSAFFKNIVIPKIIQNEGYDNYARRCRMVGLKGYSSVIKKGEYKESNNFETYMFSIIESKGLVYCKQFEIDGWFYDCYIPERNLIIEFDGDYWHAEKEEDCINDRLKNQWRIDRIKDSIAIKKSYSIIRVRESKKDTLKDII
jgi:very-short-patch-repair endonuclease